MLRIHTPKFQNSVIHISIIMIVQFKDLAKERQELGDVLNSKTFESIVGKAHNIVHTKKLSTSHDVPYHA